MAMDVRYEIRVQGLLGPVLRTAFADLQCEAVARHTMIRGRLSAEELRRLLLRLDSCGVMLDRVLPVRSPTREPGRGGRHRRTVPLDGTSVIPTG